MGIGALASVGCLVNARRRLSRLLFSLITLFLFYGVFISFTRGAWLAVFLTFFLAQFLFRDLWKKTLPLFVLGMIVLFAISGLLAESSVVQDRLLNEENVVGRVERAIWCFEQFLEKPVIGWGLNATNELMGQEFPVSGFRTSHNTFFSMLMDGGLVLFGSFIAVLVYWLVTATKLLGSRSLDDLQRSVVAVAAGMILIWALCGMNNELRYFPYFNSLLWIAGAMIESHRHWASSGDSQELAGASNQNGPSEMGAQATLT